MQTSSDAHAISRRLYATATWMLEAGACPLVRQLSGALSALARSIDAGDRERARAALLDGQRALGAMPATRARGRATPAGNLAAESLRGAEAWLLAGT